VEPLITLLKKEEFYWTQEATKYFEKRKEDMCKTLFLVTHNFKKPFIVECDGLEHGIGDILMQEGRSLSFENRQLKGKNLNRFMKYKCWSYYMQLINDSLT
jgi:hypothetical protein